MYTRYGLPGHRCAPTRCRLRWSADPGAEFIGRQPPKVGCAIINALGENHRNRGAVGTGVLWDLHRSDTFPDQLDTDRIVEYRHCTCPRSGPAIHRAVRWRECQGIGGSTVVRRSWRWRYLSSTLRKIQKDQWMSPLWGNTTCGRSREVFHCRQFPLDFVQFTDAWGPSLS